MRASDCKRLRRVRNAEPGGEPVVDNYTGAGDRQGRTSPTRARAKPAAFGGSQCGEGAKLPPLHPSLYFLIETEEDQSGGEERTPPLHPLLPSAYVCRSLIVVSVEIRLSLNTR